MFWRRGRRLEEKRKRRGWVRCRDNDDEGFPGDGDGEEERLVGR